VLKPEAIPVNLKVVLIGEHGLYPALDAFDPDFPNLFKVLADFDSSLPRDAEALHSYTRVLARIAAEEKLPPFAADAVAVLAEQGARIAGRRDRLTARFGRLADLAREAAFLARKAGREPVTREDVLAAIRRSRRRGDLPARRFRELIADGSIRIQTSGTVVGQVNGLAVSYSGPHTYGFPARITATIGPGHAGAIDIEREAELSGAIHTKGFYILGGLLRHLLRGAGHPLAFSASVAFEQSYGGIDGDSASGAEMCCLLSALTGVGLRQDVAMTGAIDQLGHIQTVGAVSEKIEGFFDICSEAGLSGDQGVILPKSNVRDLMLREDVVEACDAGRFHVWAVETIGEALEVLSGWEAGRPDENGRYGEGTLLARAMERADDFWNMTQPELSADTPAPPQTPNATDSEGSTGRGAR
jgi:ATP-dependent Lon protease